MSPCILYKNPSATITLLDIPRSLELAQGFTSATNSSQLLSSKPLEYPYPSVEPGSAKARANIGDSSLGDLLLQKHLEFALHEVKTAHEGPWCLPRVTVRKEDGSSDATFGKKRPKLDSEPAKRVPASCQLIEADHVVLPDRCIYFHNQRQTPLSGVCDTDKVMFPPESTFLQGHISETLPIFMNSAPKFNLIVLDPPWPNRSARRKKSYSISYGNSEVRSLLSSIPIYDHLTEEGLVAVWVTNRPAFREMLIEVGGLFEGWGIQLVEEWIWLKITSNGEPICALDSTWRKPYEAMLVGRKCGERSEEGVRRRVLVGVPDLHSRKPNLKCVLEDMMDRKEGDYEVLEIFARNLTAGWWSWGNEVLKFQAEEHWAES